MGKSAITATTNLPQVFGEKPSASSSPTPKHSPINLHHPYKTLHLPLCQSLSFLVHHLRLYAMASIDHKLAMAKRCAREGVIAGAKAAVVASVATAIPTLASVRMLPWARANLNHTAQALIISTVAGAAYFIVADKTVLASARNNSFKNANKLNMKA